MLSWVHNQSEPCGKPGGKQPSLSQAAKSQVPPVCSQSWGMVRQVRSSHLWPISEKLWTKVIVGEEELERVVTGIPKYLVLKKSYKIDGTLPSNINQNHFQNPIISPSEYKQYF